MSKCIKTTINDNNISKKEAIDIYNLYTELASDYSEIYKLINKFKAGDFI